MDHDLLVLVPLDDDYLSRIRGPFPSLHHAPWADLETIRSRGARTRAVWTNGTVGLNAAAIDALPELRIVHCQGAGYDQLDLAAIERRGITVTNGAGTNDACVADHAMALLLAVARDIPNRDAKARQGEWAALRTNRAALYGGRLGIVGLGKIGRQIARRAAGFDMSIGYFGRNRADDVAYDYYPDIVKLAERSDFMVLSCVGGKATRHIVNAEVLKALGANGFLVNVARASVVDTDALVEALESGGIAGAALDVFDKEPGIPERLRSVPRLVLSPHVAGSASQVRDDQIALAVRNIQGFFAGTTLENVVTGPGQA